MTMPALLCRAARHSLNQFEEIDAECMPACKAIGVSWLGPAVKCRLMKLEAEIEASTDPAS